MSAGVLLLVGAAAGGAVLSGRRKTLRPAAAIVGLVLASAGAWAHEGHDHGPDLSVSTGNSPSRRPDGSLFVPKPTQRLLEIRTRTLAVESRTRTVRFNGRIVANPNRSGVVQSTLQGRYEAPEGGVPPLGTRVKAGDLLGRVSPAFPVDRFLRHGPDARHARPGDRAQPPQAGAPGAAARHQRRGQGRGGGHAHPARGAGEAPARVAGCQGTARGSARPGRRRDRCHARCRRPGGRAERSAVPDHRSWRACWSRHWYSIRSIPMRSTRPQQ